MQLPENAGDFVGAPCTLEVGLTAPRVAGLSLVVQFPDTWTVSGHWVCWGHVTGDHAVIYIISLRHECRDVGWAAQGLPEGEDLHPGRKAA